MAAPRHRYLRPRRDALVDFDDSEAVARFVSVCAPGRVPGFETRLIPDEIETVAESSFSGLGS